ncbi:alpha/beta hydrolase [Pseudomonas sp. LS44]|uniref:alpha/beta fold hydrolase n=1 Tax=Pseudomonas sp. LS44 TaxID=1357074 RepID=UPI00215A9BB9|nr:alpha/beta hydrolase [Pseudomonas sp. LS44]UVE17963.1 alpha/beta hydrolase [Pseudomonas sp. LS44]
MEFIKLSTGRFAYTCQGQGVPILLLHGLGSSLLDWQPQIDYLSGFFKVYALDLRGHGASELLRARLGVADMAADVAEFITALECEPCFVVGISMGGMVGFQLLVSNPELVRGFVAVNSAPSFPLDSLWLRSQVALRKVLIHLLGLRVMGKLLAHKLFPYAEQTQLRAQFTERITRNDRVSYLHALRAILGWSTLPAVQVVDTPMLIVAGDRDYTPLAYKQSYVRQLRNARLAVIEDSGHATPLDQPVKFNRLVQQFIDEQLQLAARGSEAVSRKRAATE